VLSIASLWPGKTILSFAISLKSRLGTMRKSGRLRVGRIEWPGPEHVDHVPSSTEPGLFATLMQIPAFRRAGEHEWCRLAN
jgi:hypothetical protein